MARDFRFHTGKIMPELRLHYRTVGNPSGEPALILHGTGGSGARTYRGFQKKFGPATDARRGRILCDQHRRTVAYSVPN